MSDEAKRAARQMMGLFSGEIAGAREDDYLDAVRLIDAEFADVIAERDRLRKQVERLTNAVFSAVCIIQNESGSPSHSDEKNAVLKRWADEIIAECGMSFDELVDAYQRLHPDEDFVLDAALQEQTND